MLTEYKISEIDNIRINGRTTANRDPLTLFWTASGFEINIKASELWVEIESDYNDFEPWFSVLIDGAHMIRQMAVKGKSRVCIFRGRNPETIKNIKFVKDTQAMPDDNDCLLQVCKLITDGEFCELTTKPYKLEVIGDSITSGEGLYGAKSEQDWVPQLFGATNNYAFLTAEKINAELSVISQSGWGAFTGWDGNMSRAIPPFYNLVCGVINGERNAALGCKDEHDFTSWNADAVVINLGTNDCGAFSLPGFGHKIAEFEAAAVDFLANIRAKNPNAKIVWVYGMVGNDFADVIKRAIKAYNDKSGDSVSYLELPNTTPETIGAREHPGVRANEIVADILADYLINTCGLG